VPIRNRLLTVGSIIVVGAIVTLLFAWWREPNYMSTTELLMRLPKAPSPKPVSMAYQVTMPTMWHLENCSAPGEGYLGFKATAAEYQSFERNPNVAFLITERGGIDKVKLLKSSGSSALDQRILMWIHGFHFSVQKGCELSWKGEGFVNVEF
jgi:hypothetical protein